MSVVCTARAESETDLSVEALIRAEAGAEVPREGIVGPVQMPGPRWRRRGLPARQGRRLEARFGRHGGRAVTLPHAVLPPSTMPGGAHVARVTQLVQSSEYG